MVQLKKAWSSINDHLNFFRYHFLFFTITPIIFSAIFYAANGGAPPSQTEPGVRRVKYIDCLFLCFSAMTVTGIVTVNISTLQPFQQALLLILFIVGDFSFVSLIMVIVRKRFFRRHCEELLRRSETFERSTTKAIFDKAFTFSNRINPLKTYRGETISGPINARPADDFVLERMSDLPTNIRDSAIVDDDEADLTLDTGEEAGPSGSSTSQSSAVEMYQQPVVSPGTITRDFTSAHMPLPRTRTIQIVEPLPRSPTFVRQTIRARSRSMSQTTRRPSDIKSSAGIPMPQTVTMPVTTPHNIPAPVYAKHTGLGGFPLPLQLVGHLLPENTATSLRNRLGRPQRRYTLLLNRTESIAPTDIERARGPEGDDHMDGLRASIARWMPENISGLVVGRNSRFFTEELDDEELEQLGGVEYRALRLLGYLVPGYIMLFQLIPFAIISIYFSQVSSWDSAYQANSGVQQNSVNKTWTSFFLVVSGYSGCGMSLIDQGLSPFSSCYLVIFVMIAVLLAGNHALPMMLRLIIWIASKIWRDGKTGETLHFLLDHPRRCFLYLFPSHQTWYLGFLLVAFIGVEMFGFLVLNIGLPFLDNLSGFRLFADALLQSLSVRAAGFGVVSISTMAPSVLFLYVILMYVAIYPIAMSVRSTNVYEEQALGVYEPDDPDKDIEPELSGLKAKKHEVFSKYLAWHIRRQLAFDVWPLAFAIFLICIVERDKLLNPATSSWFTVFRIIFECTSAYATIGLSLGTPNNNFSFTGEFRTLSKLIVIVVMLRGRHRGLPVAIDRAILLPQAYTRFDKTSTTTAPQQTAQGQSKPRNANSKIA